MAAATRTPVTAEQFLKMDLGDGSYELVRGQIVAMPPPSFRHGRICLEIGAILREYGNRTGHGHCATNDASICISPDTVRGADICYYSEARWSRLNVGEGPPPLPPDLVVEVRSPSDASPAVMEKVTDYLKAGALMVWLVDPQLRKVAIYRQADPIPAVLAEHGIIENLPELPGFRVAVAELFA